MTQSEIEFFDMLAPQWDVNEIRSTPQRINAILDMLPIREGYNVLDLGCGTGILAPFLAERVGAEGRVVGIDLSGGMLDRARQKFGNINNVEFLKIDFEEEQIPGKYDIAFLYSVYPHLHYPKDTMEWLFKMNIKEGGIIVIAFPSDEKFINDIHHERNSDSDHLLPATQLALMIQDWGFDTDIVSDTEDAYVIVISKKL